MPTENGRNTGKIIEIKGVVIDAVFPDTLPEILSAIEIQIPRPDGSSFTLRSPSVVRTLTTSTSAYFSGPVVTSRRSTPTTVPLTGFGVSSRTSCPRSCSKIWASVGLSVRSIVNVRSVRVMGSGEP